MKILAIETSCDETAAAVVEDGIKILGSTVASSTAMQEKYGGIVPEVAAREQLKCILPVIKEAIFGIQQCSNETMKQCINEYIDAIAVTIGPGLIGSLLIGVETAKTLAFLLNKPVIPVNHVLAHMYANFVRDEQSWKSQTMKQCNNITIKFPAVSLVVSGGHTELYLMKSIKDLQWLGGTLDDAAGECFDKTARLLNFGNRGGLAIQETAEKYKDESVKYKVKLPRPMLTDESLNFSFSGLKTAVLREWKKQNSVIPAKAGIRLKDKTGSPIEAPGMTNEELTSAFAYEIQEAITDVLVKKTLDAAKKLKAKSVLISGGVAANLRLRKKFNQQLTTHNLQLFAPPPNLCTDNAVYIAAYAYFRGQPADWHHIEAEPDLVVEVSL